MKASKTESKSQRNSKFGGNIAIIEKNLVVGEEAINQIPEICDSHLEKENENNIEESIENN